MANKFTDSFSTLRNQTASQCKLFILTITLLTCADGRPTLDGILLDVDTKAALQLAEAMDPTANPCEDFFQYACGGWIKDNPIPTSESGWSQFDITNKKLLHVLEGILQEPISETDPIPMRFAREMFADCILDCILVTAAIETIGLKPLTDYLSLFGGWPMTLDHWDESTFDWKKASASAFTTFNLPLLVDFYNDLDSNNTQHTAIYVDQESLSLPRSILVDLNDSPVIATAYIELTRRLFS
ncbi:neprilysin-like [Daphnia pulex]|uniref:neprilysin-like n=1 Tax=Daphnia pulex TaxID=6669 RepID=UPI001EE02A5A|nr:neprilysin-like [Daphnia pulex]